MASKKNKVVALIGVLLFLLLLTFILINIGEPAGEEVSHPYFAPDVAHMLGGIAILMLGVSATYSILKEFSPKKTNLARSSLRFRYPRFSFCLSPFSQQCWNRSETQLLCELLCFFPHGSPSYRRFRRQLRENPSS